MIIACSPISEVIPTAIKLPNISGALILITIPLQTNSKNNIITAAHPTNPNSSAKTAKIKSLWGSDMYKYFCVLFPSPTPNNPPDPIAYKLCIICHPSPWGSCHGSKKE